LSLVAAYLAAARISVAEGSAEVASDWPDRASGAAARISAQVVSAEASVAIRVGFGGLRGAGFHGNRGFYGGRGFYGNRGFYRGYGYRRGYGFGGLGLGLGLGLAAGSLGYGYYPGYYGAYYPDYYYGGYAPVAYGYGPDAVRVSVGGDQAAYCARRFRSYDPRSGTYLGYDGLRHPCP